MGWSHVGGIVYRQGAFYDFASRENVRANCLFTNCRALTALSLRPGCGMVRF